MIYQIVIILELTHVEKAILFRNRMAWDGEDFQSLNGRRESINND